MVNALHIQTEILKIISKKKQNKIRFQKTEDSVIVTINAYNCFIIPKDEFFIDLTSHVFDGKEIDFLKMLHPDDCQTGKVTGITEFIPSEKMTLQKCISSDESIECWVDVKNIKDFGDIDFCRMSKPNYPVYMYDMDENLLGMVLPVYRKG